MYVLGGGGKDISYVQGYKLCFGEHVQGGAINLVLGRGGMMSREGPEG